MQLAEQRAHYREVKKRLAELKPKTAQIIPINVVPLEAPVPVVVVPTHPPEKPYLVKREIPMLQDIFEEVRLFYGIDKIEFLSKRRTGNIARARQIAVYLCREMTLKSYPEIGRQLGGRDHTTALHGARKIQGLLVGDERLADEIQIITIRINERVARRNEMVSESC